MGESNRRRQLDPNMVLDDCHDFSGILKLDLSVQQREAFESAIAWHKSKSDAPFVLRGYAGTGKTFCVQRIIKAIQSQEKIKIAICAPTHKAVHILRRMAQESQVNAHVTTLHSLLHVMPGEYDSLGRAQLKSNLWSKEPFYREFGLVVIDEASMVDCELMALIEAQDTPALFMGDPAQLPPINESESTVFQLPNGYELTQVMRYTGAIASYATALRQNLNAQFPPRLQTQGNITKCLSEKWESKLIDAFNEADEDDQFAVRALAWTNQRASKINSLVRQQIMGVGEEEPFVKGEKLVAKEPILLSEGSSYINHNGEHIQITDPKRKTIFMSSCAECTISDVREGSARFGNRRFHCYYLDVESDLDTETTLTLIHPESWEHAKDFINQWKKDILEIPSDSRKYEWARFYDFLETFNLVAGRSLMHRLQYAYCQTIHQSQGGTFKQVFLDLPNIFGCRDVKLRNQLLYVGATRASDHLYVLSKF